MIIPITNRVLIEKQYTEKIGDIYLPEEAVPESQIGTVLAIGEDVKDIEVGDTVVFPKYTGTNFTIKGRKYFSIEQEYVLAVVVKEEV